MNILTFDIEEWYLEKVFNGNRASMYQRFDDAFARLLDMLERQSTHATFFCVGQMAVDFPEVIKLIKSRGHEVGCHSNEHTWLDKMDEETMKRDTSEAIKALEDVTGQKVISYRAPAFSITPKNKWAINVLADCGIENDASIYPSSRDFGGYFGFPQDTPCIIQHTGVSLREFPICLTSFLGKRIAYSGGGYFRILPKSFVSHISNGRSYNIYYFHLRDLIEEKFGFLSRSQYEEYFKEKGSLKNRLLRFVKDNASSGNTFGKLSELIKDNDMISVQNAVENIDWTTVNKIVL